jgi:Fe-S cluster assembly iron-binding protein IscA
MLTVTETAGQHLSQILEQAPGEAVVRFIPQENGLAMQLDNVRPGDTTFEHEEKPVLAMDTRVAEALDGRTLDVQSTEEGPRLALS